MTDAIRESNETFARSLNQISSSMSTVAQSLARSFEFMSQIMFNNNSQQRHYPSNLSTSCNQDQPLYDKIDSSFNEFGYVGGRNTLMNHETMKVVQRTNNYSKIINETRLKLLHFDIMLFFFSSIKSPSKNNVGFSSFERFLM